MTNHIQDAERYLTAFTPYTKENSMTNNIDPNDVKAIAEEYTKYHDTLTTEQLLNELVLIEHQASKYTQAKEDVLEQLIPDVVLDQIKIEHAALDVQIKIQQAKVAIVKKIVKDQVLEAKATVATDNYSAVYNTGRKTWDTKGLEGYAVDHPQIYRFQKEGNPSVSFRKVKNGKK